METQQPAPTPPGEPRSLTLLDLMALVAGVAVGFVLPSRTLGVPVMFGSPEWLLIALLAIWTLRVAGLGVGVVVVARRARYGRLPRPAEWLVILIGLTLLVEALPNVDEAVNATWAVLGVGEVPFSRMRWFWAGLALVAALVTFGAAIASRGRLPDGGRTILLIAAALASLWGPLTVLPQELPSHPLWSVPAPLPPDDDRWFWFWAGLGLRKGIAQLPTAVLFALPAVATAVCYRRRGTSAWIWPEWVGAVAAVLIVLGALVFFGFVIFNDPGDIERNVRVLCWPVAFGLALVIVRRLGPAWNRAVGSGYDRHQSTPATPEG